MNEWIETGAQARAAAKLVEWLGAKVVGIATICMDSNDRTESIRAQYTVHTV